jgi:hypothetical protein
MAHGFLFPMDVVNKRMHLSIPLVTGRRFSFSRPALLFLGMTDGQSTDARPPFCPLSSGEPDGQY